jgi:hypothetical protein
VNWTRFRPNQDPKDLGSMGERLIRKYMGERAPAIQPVAVERWLHGIIGGVHINARLDILDERGTVVETKTMGAKRKASPMHRFQATTYRQLEPQASGLIQLDGLVKTKSPALTAEEWQVTPEDIVLTEQLYPIAREGQRSGLFPPNRFSLLCTKRQCSYASRCMVEWGGEVPE